MNKTFPGGRKKCLTLSYDDGVRQDIRLISLLDKYGLKATFNLNAGFLGRKGMVCHHGFDVDFSTVTPEEVAEVYKNHEVAMHALTHKPLAEATREELVYQMTEDKRLLERYAGRPVGGMAYPNGSYNEAVIAELDARGVKYARVVPSKRGFGFPERFLEWFPTMHHGDPDRLAIARAFLEGPDDGLKLFYIWGHAYEFDYSDGDHWAEMEELCALLGGRDDVWYATNMDVYNFVKGE